MLGWRDIARKKVLRAETVWIYLVSLGSKRRARERTYGICSPEVESECRPFMYEFHISICANGGDGLREERRCMSFFAHLLLYEGIGLVYALDESLGHCLSCSFKACTLDPGGEVFH